MICVVCTKLNVSCLGFKRTLKECWSRLGHFYFVLFWAQIGWSQNFSSRLVKNVTANTVITQ